MKALITKSANEALAEAQLIDVSEEGRARLANWLIDEINAGIEATLKHHGFRYCMDLSNVENPFMHAVIMEVAAYYAVEKDYEVQLTKFEDDIVEMELSWRSGRNVNNIAIYHEEFDDWENTLPSDPEEISPLH